MESIYSRTVRIEKIIGVNLEEMLNGKSDSVEKLFLKYNSVFKAINHLKFINQRYLTIITSSLTLKNNH